MVYLRQRRLNKMRRVFLIFFILIISQPLYAVTAKVAGNRVNARIRPVLGSEIVTQLSFGEEVEVLEEGAEWTKIKRPAHSRCWIHSDYVESGRIIAGSVNMRCGPGLAFPVLCQLDRGTEVNIVEVIGDWMRIEPPVEFGVWISSQYIEHPEPVETAKEKIVEEEEIVEEKIVEESAPFVCTPEIPPTVSVPPEEIPKVELVSYAGTLEDLGIIINRPGTYKLISNGKWVCILKSPTLDLNPYVNRVVRIDGVGVAVASSWDVPVIEVKRLRVIK